MLIGLFAVAFADVSHLKGNYNYPKPAASQSVSQIAIPSSNSIPDVIGKQSAALNREYLPSVQVASSNNNQVFVTSPTTVQPIISKPKNLFRDYLPPVQINSFLDSPSEVHAKIEATTGRVVVISSSAPQITTSKPVTHASVSTSKYVTSVPSLVSISGQGSIIVPKVVDFSTSAAPVIITGSPSTIAPVTSGYKYVTPDLSVQGSNVVQQTNGYKYPAGDPSLISIPGQGSKLIGSESIASPSTVIPSHSLGVDGYKYKIPKVAFNSRK